MKNISEFNSSNNEEKAKFGITIYIDFYKELLNNLNFIQTNEPDNVEAIKKITLDINKEKSIIKNLIITFRDNYGSLPWTAESIEKLGFGKFYK